MLEEKLKRLKSLLATFSNVVVAYSGGVDSTFLLKVATDVLGERAVGGIGVSPSLPHSELKSALDIAEQFGMRVVTIPTHEMEDENYTRNPENRCYFCKKELFSELLDYAREHGYHVVADGTNLDDLGDHRPGLKAAQEFEIRSPLKEAGLRKKDIRELSRILGLPTWNKPEMACLSSRFPTGTPITAAALKQVEAAEDVLRRKGFRQVRVRHHGQLARIEVAPDEWFRWVDEHLRLQIEQALRALGYAHVTLDLKPYHRGQIPVVVSNQSEDDSRPS